ncbi:MAG: copper chaperone PCu(A)C [Rhodospirillaceae bacterium]|nr:copper chaperone PCu(A)C [Rhodospirillaceae bacterium]
MNHGAEADRLLSLSSSAARMAELHVTKMDGDVMKMEAAGIIDLPPNTTVEMKPGGLHVMLVGLTAPLEGGVKASTSSFISKAGDVTVSVPVGAAAAGSHDHGLIIQRLRRLAQSASASSSDLMRP